MKGSAVPASNWLRSSPYSAVLSFRGTLLLLSASNLALSVCLLSIYLTAGNACRAHKKRGSDRGTVVQLLGCIIELLARSVLEPACQCEAAAPESPDVTLASASCACHAVSRLSASLQPCALELSQAIQTALSEVRAKSALCSQPVAAADNPVADAEAAFASLELPDTTGLWERTKSSLCSGGCGRKIRLYCSSCELEASCPLESDPRHAIRSALAAALPEGVCL